MIETILFLKDHRVFKAGETIGLRPGVNLLVGDQGSGKSTLLEALAVHIKAKTAPSGDPNVLRISNTKPFRPVYFDFEKHNPRVQPAFDMGYGYDMMFQLQSMGHSHGEFVRIYMAALSKVPADACALLDEPDAALSPRSAYRLVDQIKAMAARGAQVIVAVHNPILIESQPEVLSLEHRRWMPSAEFLELMRTTDAPPSPEPPKPKTTTKEKP